MKLARAFLGAALALSACGRSGLETPRGLVLVSLDTVRADAIGHLGGRAGATPNLDRLAAEGATFADTWAPRGQTWPALATLLSGLYPPGHGVRENGQALPGGIATLAELLSDRGFRTGAFLANACEEWGTDRFDYLFCAVEAGGSHTKQAHRWDRRVVEEGLAWIGDGAGEPFFAWIHMIDAHRPYPTIPKLRERFLDPAYDGPFRVAEGEEEVEGGALPFHARVHELALRREPPASDDLDALRAHYDAGVFGNDVRIGEVAEALAARGLLDEVLLIVTADHGEELFDHASYPYHSASVHGSTLRVPLVFRWPARIVAGGHFADPAGLEDVAPTVLELFDLPAGTRERPFHGRSLAPLLVGESAALAPRDHLSELVDADLLAWKARYDREGIWGAIPVLDQAFAIRRGRWRLLWNPRGLAVKAPPFEEFGVVHPTALYDLEADPGETLDVSAEHPEVVAELRAALEAWTAELLADTPEVEAPSERALEDLDQLGYLGEDDR